jgi:hypothetical protein
VKAAFPKVLVLAALLASGPALACEDDARMTGGDDGGMATNAPQKPVVAADKPVTLTSVKQKVTTKQQKSAAKPLPQGVTLARGATN